MKTKILILLICGLFCLTNIYAQEQENSNNSFKHSLSFDLGVFYTPVTDYNTYGMYIGLKFYPTERFSTGISIITGIFKEIDNNFFYEIEQPWISMAEVGWVCQYNLIEYDKIILGVNLNNGWVEYSLRDNSEKENFVISGGDGFFLNKPVPKTIVTNRFYLLQPGLNISVKLTEDLYLTTEAKYRFAFGNSNFGQTKDFSDFYLGLGITINMKRKS